MFHLTSRNLRRHNQEFPRLKSQCEPTTWAVVITVAVISVAFSGPSGHHSVIFLSTILITLFLFLEDTQGEQT